jgi:hypothetical protein
LEEEVAANHESYARVSSQMPAGSDTPLECERLALDHGLVREAMAVLASAAVVPDRAGFRAAARSIRLDLDSIGDSDDADARFRDTMAWGVTVPDEELRAEFERLSVLVPLARGDYSRARQALMDNSNRRAGPRPPNPSAAQPLAAGQLWDVSPVPEPALVCLPLVATYPWLSLGQACFEVGVAERTHTFRVLREEAGRELRMGLIALEEGNAAAARGHFEAATRPRGVPVAFPDRPLAVRYLELMGG